jgi:putative GTP pyrophosphokinase
MNPGSQNTKSPSASSIELKDHVPESESEFGYFGRHYILFVQSDVIVPGVDKSLLPRVFELQVKTLFQHAWAEGEHDLGYKLGAKPLTKDDKRRFAFASAQAWGADRMFEELFQERSK